MSVRVKEEKTILIEMTERNLAKTKSILNRLPEIAEIDSHNNERD